ncbi:hypothetical protein [Mesorhizobium sanjuanii]|uniref:hypothetical protein n=1 Tax=Mesorhizobium sanjuanii TaxID=2037900 RepID=UPI001AD83717|nr:hypothetical protein [Mesorhizobium sanjuanii]
MNLAIRTLKSALVGLLVLAVIIFVPAGTLAYWQGWTFLIVFTLSTNIIGIYLALRNPALPERRIKAGPGAETRPAQKIIITLAFAGAIALVIVSVLDYRFGWSHVPAWISVLGNLLVALCPDCRWTNRQSKIRTAKVFFPVAEHRTESVQRFRIDTVFKPRGRAKSALA